MLSYETKTIGKAIYRVVRKCDTIEEALYEIKEIVNSEDVIIKDEPKSEDKHKRGETDGI